MTRLSCHSAPILTICLTLAMASAMGSHAWAQEAQGSDPSPDTRPIVWVFNGAGDYRGCSRALSEAGARYGDPVEIVVAPWSHGYRRLVLDHVDGRHIRTQGKRFAEAIKTRALAEPHRRQILLGHSAGTAVLLAATESLLPDTIDRIILLAPSVSARYNLEPATRASREGIDVYCSRKDVWALGAAIRLIGTNDARFGRAAGRVGFRESRLPPGNQVRMHFWSPEVAWTGNDGSHYGAYAPEFVRSYLYPIMQEPLAVYPARGLADDPR